MDNMHAVRDIRYIAESLAPWHQLKGSPVDEISALGHA